MHVLQLKREKKTMTIKLSYSIRLANQGKGSTHPPAQSAPEKCHSHSN